VHRLWLTTQQHSVRHWLIGASIQSADVSHPVAKLIGNKGIDAPAGRRDVKEPPPPVWHRRPRDEEACAPCRCHAWVCMHAHPRTLMRKHDRDASGQIRRSHWLGLFLEHRALRSEVRGCAPAKANHIPSRVAPSVMPMLRLGVTHTVTMPR
jgi:hypothetical protein